MMRPALRAAALVALAALIAAAPAGAKTAKETYLPRVEYPGMQKLTYKIGPLPIKPGADDIRFRNVGPRFRPKVPGYITRFRPTLTRADGSLPSVDVIHLHHAVWLSNLRPTWAAGEEKTAMRLPGGYGWKYRTSDRWILNHMIHNLTPSPDRVWVTWDMDFVPARSAAARGIHTVDTEWIDAVGAAPIRSSTPCAATAATGATRSTTRR